MPSHEPTVLCEFLIPLVRDGDRQPHPQVVWDALHDALFRCFGGYTGPEVVVRLRRSIPGQYRAADGRRVSDESRLYKVALPQSELARLRAVLRAAARSFDQEAIFLAVRGEVEFVTATKADGFLTDLAEEEPGK